MPKASTAPVVITTAAATTATNNVSSPVSMSLSTYRAASAEGDAKAYGATRTYAQKLIESFGQNFWRKDSPKFADWQAERKLYDEELKAKNHPNPSQAHKRLLQRADDICNPKESGGANDRKSLTRRAVEESSALYSAFKREEAKAGLDDNEKRICDFIASSKSNPTRHAAERLRSMFQ